MHLFIVAVITGYVLFFYPQNYTHIIFMCILFLLSWYIYLQKKYNLTDKLILSTVFISATFNFCLTTHIYPQLMTYQTQAYAGKFAYQNNIPHNMFYTYRTRAHALDFYARRAVEEINLDSIKYLKTGTYIYTHQEGLNDIMQRDNNFKIIKSMAHYHITALKLPFLMKNTRHDHTEKRYIIQKI
jgi:uncharacterized protein YlbG (UPF0298 family)